MFYLVLRDGLVAAVVEDLSSRHKTQKTSSLPSVALDPRDPTTSSSCISYLLQLKIFVCLCLFYFTTLGLFAILGRLYTVYHQLFPIISSSMVSGSFNRVFPFFPFIFLSVVFFTFFLIFYKLRGLEWWLYEWHACCVSVKAWVQSLTSL